MQVQRPDMLSRLRSEVFDVLVIGGGATGAGAALDAASRGVSVALVERDDFASGTSSRSTKLIHGGVRYLEQAVKRLDTAQFRLVRDALHERALLLKIAPHLTRPLPLLTPLYRRRDVPYVWAGLKIYDRIAGRANLARSRFLTPSRALRRVPMLRREGLRGAVLYYDGQFDDARMNVLIAMTAVARGAAAANHLAVASLIKEGGRLCGAEVADAITGERFTILARSIINATGPFTDQVRRLDDPDVEPIMAVSTGIHIIFDQRFIPPDTGLLIPKTEDGRVLFLLPWLGHTLAGTTDNPADVEEHPRATDAEIEYLIRHVREYFDLPIERDDIRAAWSGLRPLVARGAARSTAALSRDHVILTSPSGLITVTGGKWTTYRHMAMDAVDEAVRTGGLSPRNPSRTDSIFILGGEGYSPGLFEELMQRHGFDRVTARHLARSYGDRAETVAETARPTHGRPLAPGHPHLEAEVIYAVQHEMAVTAMDVLARRMRLAFVDRTAAEHALPRVLEIMAERLGWGRRRMEEERREVLLRLAQGL